MIGFSKTSACVIHTGSISSSSTTAFATTLFLFRIVWWLTLTRCWVTWHVAATHLGAKISAFSLLSSILECYLNFNLSVELPFCLIGVLQVLLAIEAHDSDDFFLVDAERLCFFKSLSCCFESIELLQRILFLNNSVLCMIGNKSRVDKSRVVNAILFF